MLKIFIKVVAKVAVVAALGILFSIALAAESDDFDVAEVYQARCYACHGTGGANAPILGDVIAWEIRMEKGMDTVIQNVINGLNGMMPPRGLCAECSDDDLKALTEYILEMSK